MLESGALSIFGSRTTSFTAGAKSQLAGLMRVGKVTTATSTTIFESTDLIGQDDDAFLGWYVSVLQADNTAPEGEMQPISDYVSTTGRITHTVFGTQLDVGDWVVLLRPEIAMLGAVDTTAATGAVSTSKYLMAYVKQIVTAAIAEAASTARVLSTLDFWSGVGEEVVVTGTQSTVTAGLNNVVVADLPAGAAIVRAIVMMKFRMVENTYAGINKLDATAALPMQIDDVASTGMLTCLDFADDLFTLGDTVREGGDIIIGDIDVAARVDANDTYDFQWLNAKADQNNINFNDVQMGLRIWYSV